MRFEVLGPLRVTDAGTEVPITAVRERILLAMLLLHANNSVLADTLIDAIWESDPPKHPQNQIHGCVSRLRRRLAATGDELIGTTATGYRITVAPQDLDLYEFRRLVVEARAAIDAGHAGQAAAGYRTALDLWRGPALAGIDSPPVRNAATVLDESRTQALEECVHAELAAGATGELVAELTDLVRQHPFREKLHGALMLALYRAGRQADALAAYRSAHQLLHDELGTEPSAELQELQRAILQRDPQLQVPRPAGPAPSTRPAPRELPADVAGFTGRDEALMALDKRLPDSSDESRTVVISAIDGTAGVGKTALAVHWSHHHADLFPDGQLYVNLRGYDPDQPVAPADALARFLAALGVAEPDIPHELEDRAARYRSETAQRRMLIVLDNAATVTQVRPLLPGTGTCLVVVTSRDSLAGLVARHGAHRLDLDLLPPDDAVALLRRLIGSRVDADPAAAATLAEQCARLPLALRVAAELAVSRRDVPLADLVVELDDRQRRLELLDAGGDPYSAVRYVFSWSIQHLPAETARTFRLLGLHPGPDIDLYATAALAGISLDQAREMMTLLARVHLVHSTGPDRYGMHDLLRAYAVHLARADDSSQLCEAALDRLFDYYLGTAAAAMDGWYPAKMHRRPRVPAPTTPTLDLADPDTARAWLDAELRCLVAAAAYAANHGRPTFTIPLARTLYRYLTSVHYPDALAIHGHARRAAERAGDLAGQAYALRSLGTTYSRLGVYRRAAEHYEQALALFRRAGHQTGEATALTDLGRSEQESGRCESAVVYHEQALALFRRIGEAVGEAAALNNLGSVEAQLGRYGPAAEHLGRALDLFRWAGDQGAQASTLNCLGNLERRLGRYESAAEHCRQALTLARQFRIRHGEAAVLDSLGNIYVHLGRLELATEHFRRALALLRESGERAEEAPLFSGLGDAAHADGRPSDAATHHRTALTIADEVGDRAHQARAHLGLGDAHRSLADHTRARTHYEQALLRYTKLRIPEAEEVRARLAALDRAAVPCPTDARTERK